MTIKAEVKTMALKNLFDMVKADRYTADGREALIKAQEAETEDKVYQIGEISQKTGLQKTANGWVKPKNGKQPGAKQEEPKNVHGAEVDKIYERQLKRIKELKAKGFTDEQIDNDKIIKQTKEDMKNVGKKPESKPAAEKWSKTKDYLDRERISMKTPQGGMVSIYETDNPGQKNNRFRVDTGSHANYFNTMEEAKAFAEKHYGEGSESKPAETKTYKTSDIERVDKNNLKLGEVSATKNPDNTWSVKNAEGKEVSRALRMEDVKEAMVKSANRKPGDTKFPNVSKEQKIETLANHYRERYGKTTEEWAKTLKEVPEETLEDRYEEYAKKHPTDSAPRVLTGDTRIRVRKA